MKLIVEFKCRTAAKAEMAMALHKESMQKCMEKYLIAETAVFRSFATPKCFRAEYTLGKTVRLEDALWLVMEKCRSYSENSLNALKPKKPVIANEKWLDEKYLDSLYAADSDDAYVEWKEANFAVEEYKEEMLRYEKMVESAKNKWILRSTEGFGGLLKTNLATEGTYESWKEWWVGTQDDCSQPAHTESSTPGSYRFLNKKDGVDVDVEIVKITYESGRSDLEIDVEYLNRFALPKLNNYIRKIYRLNTLTAKTKTAVSESEVAEAKKNLKEFNSRNANWKKKYRCDIAKESKSFTSAFNETK